MYNIIQKLTYINKIKNTRNGLLKLKMEQKTPQIIKESELAMSQDKHTPGQD